MRIKGFNRNVYSAEVGWLLEFYILATSKVITGWVATCDNALSK